MASAPYQLVWALLIFAWIANYLVRMALPALLPPIIAELALSYTQAGLLATAVFFYAYALMQFPAGLLGDRFGRKRVLITGLVAGGVAAALTGLAGTFAALLAARLLTGLSQGCLFSNDRAIIAAVTPRDKIALGQGISFSGPGLGITVGLLLGGLLGTVMPWRHVFFVVAVPPVLAALLVGRFVPATQSGAASRPLWARVRHVAAVRDVWVLGLAGTTSMWVQYVMATWAPLLFMEVGVRELGRAASFASLQGLAGVAGLLAGGWFGDRARRRGVGHRAVIAVFLGCLGAASMALAAVVQQGRSPAALAATLLVVSFFAWGIWGPSFALLGELFAGDDLSTTFGLYNTVCVLGAVVGPVVTGWARDVTGSFAAGCYGSAAVALAGAATALLIRASARPRVARRV